MKCAIQIACNKKALGPEMLTKTAIAAIMTAFSTQLDLTDNTVTIRIVEPTESQALNKTYRGQDKPTNVLSFRNQHDNHFKLPRQFQNHLGDLILCHEVIAKEALIQNKTLKAHYTHLLVHGLLHLLAYDHETAAESMVMEQLEIKLLKTLAINNPYEDQIHGA